MVLPLATSLPPLLLPSFFFPSDLAQLSPNWSIHVPLCFKFFLSFFSYSLHCFICLFFSKILPSSCSPVPTPCLFSFPPLCHFSLSPSQSLLSAKESELQECQGRLAQLEEQLRAAQTGADRATIVRMKQVSF